MTAVDPTTAWLSDFVVAALDEPQVEAWVDRIATAAVQELPELTRDPDLAGLVRATVDEQWRAFLAGLDGPESHPALVPSAADLAVELARRHHELPVLLGAYRAAQREAWAYATEVARAAPDEIDRSAVLIALWSRAGQWLDHALGASVVVHQDERRRVRHSGAAQRFEVVRAILSGDDPGRREIATGLGGYPLGARHTVVLVRALAPEGTTRLEAGIHALAAAMSSGHALVVEPGGRELWAWVPDGDPGRLGPVDVPPGLLAAVGGPAAGLDGFRAAHAEALEAQRVALASRRPTPLTAYADVAGLALLARDPVAAEAFARRVLGAVAEDTPAAARMRQTLRAVLANPGRTEAAAAALSVHKNTVRYRLGQAERTLGRPVTERSGDLELALRYFDTFLAPVTGPQH